MIVQLGTLPLERKGILFLQHKGILLLQHKGILPPEQKVRHNCTGVLHRHPVGGTWTAVVGQGKGSP